MARPRVARDLPGTLLGGTSPLYGLYQTRDTAGLSWLRWNRTSEGRIRTGPGIESLTSAGLGATFATRTSAEWDQWAKEQDVPLAAVREPACPSP